MRIIRRKITASSKTSTRIPAPFNKYYEIASDDQVNEYTGYTPEEGELSPCEECEGYDIIHLSWVIAKPEYRAALANSGLDVVELISEDGEDMLAYAVHDRIYAVDEDEVKDALGADERSIEFSTKPNKKTIEASTSTRIPAPFDKYYTLISDEEVENLTGEPADPSPCEQCEGYGVVHLGYAQAKPEYMDYLSDMGIADVELLDAYGDTYLGYCVHDRIYPVELSDMPDATGSEDISSSTAIYGDEDDPGRDAFEDDPVAGIAAMLSISYDDAEDIFDRYDAVGATADYDDVSEFLDFVNNDIRDSLEGKNSVIGPMNDSLKESISQGIEGCDQITVTSAVDIGQYWYYSRHGMGPGTIPSGVTVLDWYEEGYKTWILLDKMLTTKELNEYELKEQMPPSGSVTHNGTTIEGGCNIKASTVKEVNETDDSIEYVVSSTEPVKASSDDFIVDYPLTDEIVDRDMQRWSQMELDDEADAYDREHSEGEYADESDLVISVPVDTTVSVADDGSVTLEDKSFLQEYVPEGISFDDFANDFELLFMWAVPANSGKYNITADATLTYVPDGNGYHIDTLKSTVVPKDIQPASKFDAPAETSVESSTEVSAASSPMMTEEELDSAILDGRPFDLGSFKKYKVDEVDGILRADEVKVGDVIAVTEDASEVNIGTVVRVLSINDPDRMVDWATYTFHVQLLESPEQYWHNGLDPYRDVTGQPGDEMDLHFDAEDYVGPLV